MRKFKGQGSEYSRSNKLDKSRASQIYSNQSNSSASRQIIDRIIANKDGKTSEIMRQNYSDHEGGDEAGETDTRLDRLELGESYPTTRDAVFGPNSLDDNGIPVRPDYTLVPQN